jgi:hypothetical protein
MPPALAARVEASVTGTLGDGQAGRSRWKPASIALARGALAIAAVATVAGFVSLWRHSARERDGVRSALIERARGAGASLTADDRQVLGRIDAWLSQAADAYAGDLIEPEVKGRGNLAALLAGPTVYVRGTMNELGARAGIDAAAATSTKDPLIACLVDPPASRAEAVMLAKVRAAYAGDPDGRTAHVTRLRDAQVGLPFLAPSWSEAVARSKSEGEMAIFRHQFEGAPIAAAVQAAKSRALVFAVDEPGEPGHAVELDGERAHMVRVEIVDIASGKVLLRLRRHVDPSGISATKRPMYASGLDGCGLALDVFEAVDKA